MNILNLLVSTILMLKKSVLKDYLFKVMTNLNKLELHNNFNDSTKYKLDENIIENINIILENMDEWIRHYNSEIRMSMKKELMINLGEIKKIFRVVIE
jgi:hypothetical protein